ncbi:MAG: pantoate--beta-alanine ligase [Actinomycetota bacterium]
MSHDRPHLVRTPEEVRTVLDAHRRAGRTIGFVPTMGALHEGHLSLVRAAAAADDVVVVSIFVNPLQFGEGEDLDAYPRTLDADLDLLAPEGVALVFSPAPSDFTPETRRTTVHVEGLTGGLEASTRPTHFDGVTTIVTKLFNVIGADHAYFGEKDFQQQAILRRMALDLDMRTEVVTCPIVREADGLALSSRNVYLSPDQRRDALALSQALRELADGWEGNVDSGRSTLLGRLTAAQGIQLDYAEIIDPETLEPLEGVRSGDCQAVVAAWVGTTRLIDTMRLRV